MYQPSQQELLSCAILFRLYHEEDEDSYMSYLTSHDLHLQRYFIEEYLPNTNLSESEEEEDEYYSDDEEEEVPPPYENISDSPPPYSMIPPPDYF